MKIISNTARVIFWVLSLSVALVSLRFLVLGLDVAFANMQHHLDARRLVFAVHVSMGPVALALMPFQFLAGLRARRPRLHRTIGRIYALAVLTGGISGLYIAVTTNAGPVAATGFGLLALAWMATTAIGIRAARAGRYGAHRRWMIRSAALTFAGVTLRMWLAIGILSGLPFGLVYPVAAWLCWLLKLALVEPWLRRRNPPDPTGALTA